jgi:hypothetical protein
MCAGSTRPLRFPARHVSHARVSVVLLDCYAGGNECGGRFLLVSRPITWSAAGRGADAAGVGRAGAWLSQASSLLSGPGLRSGRSGCRPACGSGPAAGGRCRAAEGGETPGLCWRRRACPVRGLHRRLGKAGLPLTRTTAASHRRTAGRTGRSDDRSQSKSFHISFEPSTPFGVVALSHMARTYEVRSPAGRPHSRVLERLRLLVTNYASGQLEAVAIPTIPLPSPTAGQRRRAVMEARRGW